MLRTPRRRPLLVAAALAFLAGPAAGAGFPYEDWDKVLTRFVNEKGRVNYEALARDRANLDRFLAAVERTSPKSNPELFATTNARLAYYLNAYNAQVFRGVLARGPEKESVWTGGLFSGTSFFVGTKIAIGGEKTSLKSLEDDVVRGQFHDPRVHAGLNCASVGCPRLPQISFDAEKLDAQLDAAMTEFVGETRNVEVGDAAKTVTLSKIFDWFEKDFLAYEKAHGNPNGNPLDYVNRYRGPLPKVPRDYRIRFFEYDKALNRQ